MEARLWRVFKISQKVKTLFDGYWIWFVSSEKPPYHITGKYLFFSNLRFKLEEIAVNEIENHEFHRAKINESLIEGQTEHVLCLYYSDDSRKYELHERNDHEYGVKYRYWKTDADTRAGKYDAQNYASQTNQGTKKGIYLILVTPIFKIHEIRQILSEKEIIFRNPTL